MITVLPTIPQKTYPYPVPRTAGRVRNPASKDRRAGGGDEVREEKKKVVRFTILGKFQKRVTSCRQNFAAAHPIQIIIVLTYHPGRNNPG